jgi:hypothetical protein
VDVKSRASRILRRLASYSDLTRGSPVVPLWLREIPLQEGEHCLGIYENAPGGAADSVLVTNLGLHVCCGSRREYVAFDEIESVTTHQAKTEVTELEVHRRDGRVTQVPVSGGHDRLRDAWEFVRFLNRVREDQEQRGTAADPPDSGA